VDKIELYRNAIQDLLQKHSQHSPKNNREIENELIVDKERDSPIGDALRTLPAHARWLARNEAYLPHHHALRHQRRQNLDPAKHNRRRYRSRTHRSGSSQRRHCSRIAAALQATLHRVWLEVHDSNNGIKSRYPHSDRPELTRAYSQRSTAGLATIARAPNPPRQGHQRSAKPENCGAQIAHIP
jgi:hypothetical protein